MKRANWKRGGPCQAVYFFDFYGTLVVPWAYGFRTRPDIVRHLGELNGCLGILANYRGGTGEDLVRQVAELGLDRFFQEDMIFAASDLREPLPHPQAFRIAAAMAGAPVQDCSFISADPVLVRAAAEAGMETLTLADLELGKTSGGPALSEPEPETGEIRIY